MTLIVCTECGKEYSSKAQTCPHCGCPSDLYRKVVQQADSIISGQESYLENLFKKVIDVLFIGLYLLICYKIFWDDINFFSATSEEVGSNAIGFIIGMGIIFYIHRLIRNFIGSIPPLAG